jgi:hypothetical protein
MKTPKTILNSTHNCILLHHVHQKIHGQQKEREKILTPFTILLMLFSQYQCIFVDQTSESCMGLLVKWWAILLVTNLFSHAFFFGIHCNVGLCRWVFKFYYSIEVKNVHNKMLLGCTFTKYIIIALGFRLFCLIRVVGTNVVFFRTCVKSMIAKKP